MQYDFRLPPYKHQWKEFKRHRKDRARALLWQMRSGKTKECIDTACYWFKKGWIDGVLIFAPNGVHQNWTDVELEKHHWETIPFRQVSWSTEAAKNSKWREKFQKSLDSKKLFWFSVNSESIKYAKKYIGRFCRGRRFLFLVDESDDFGIPKSERTKVARAIAPRAQGVRIMSGTPVENSPLHAWSQYELLERGALGYKEYEPFKRHFAEYERARNRNRHYERLVGYRHLKELRQKMSEWSSVVLREDCDDMPDLIMDRRIICLTEEQHKIYRQLHKQFEIEVGDGIVNIGINTSRMMKLQQVLSGFIIDEAQVIHTIPGGNPKAEAFMQDLDLIRGKLVVWCQFRQDVRFLTKMMADKKIEFAEYHGGISNRDKRIARDRFLHDKRLKVLIGNARAGGRGTDFSSAKDLIWYSHTFDAKVRKQGLERCTKVGAHDVGVSDYVVPNSVESYILECVEKKVSIAAMLAGRGMKKLLERTRL